MRLRRLGLCEKCGDVETRDGKTTCGPCGLRVTEYARKYRATKGVSEKVYTNARARVDRLYKTRRANGVCVFCGNNPPTATTQACVDCNTIAADRQLRRTFGITLADYNARLQQQNGVCAICEGPSLKHKRFSVDHDHDTGAVRGLLCIKCNVGLGSFKDNADELLKAVAYLHRHKSQDVGRLSDNTEQIASKREI
jgi:hypothetical protein